MRKFGGAGSIVAAAALGALVLVGATIGIAEANPFFASQTGKNCVDCHIPGQEQRGVQGLNGAGQAFKNCGFQANCAAKPAAKTSETTNGIVTLGNNKTCPGQTRWVVLRPGKNEKDRDIILFLDTGHSVKVAVSRGTTWASSCGGANDNQQFSWVPLDQAVD
jgi:hypothetical protein